MSLTAAEAWALAARMWQVERDAAEDECPRRPDSHQRYVEAAKQARDANDRSVALDASDGVLKRALAKWSTPVQRAAHYATPMSAADKRKALSQRSATCRVISNAEYAERAGKAKPTKRSGTKPSSLAQRLAAACHTLKEP